MAPPTQPRRRGIRRLAMLLATALTAGTFALAGTVAAQAAPGDYTVEITAPVSTPVRQAFSYTVTLDLEASAAAPATGIVLTTVLDEGVRFDSVPTGADSPVASVAYDATTRTVTFTMKDLAEELTSFVFSVQQDGNELKDESTLFDATITGSATPSGAAPSDSVQTAVTGDFEYRPMKNFSTVVGSGNRAVTYTLNLATIDANGTSDTFATWGQRFFDQLPIGAEVTNTSSGYGTWTVTGTPETGQSLTWENANTATHYGPSGSSLSGTTNQSIDFTVNYPEEVFPDGTRPPVNTVSYEVQDRSGNWHTNGQTASVQGPEMVGGIDKKIAIGKYSDPSQSTKQSSYSDGYFAHTYRVQASYLNTVDAEQLDQMVVSDAASASAENARFFSHTDIYNVSASFSSALRAAAVPFTFEYQVNGQSTWQTYAGTFTTATNQNLVVQRVGSSGYGSNQTGVVELNLGEHLTGWRYTLSPGASDATIPSGSEINVLTTLVPLYESVTDNSTSSEFLPNVATATGTLTGGAAIEPASDTASIRFEDAVYITTNVLAPSTIAVGGSAIYRAAIVNQNETDTYTDSKMKVVLPAGVFYNAAVGATPSDPNVLGTNLSVPEVGDGVTVSTETITDSAGVQHQVVVFTFDTLPPMRPFGQSSSRYVENDGYRYDIPVTVVAQAYDPAETTVPVTSWAYTDDPNYTNVPMNGYGPFFASDENDFDANRTLIARATANSEVVTAGGLLIGKLVRASESDGWGNSAVVTSPGTAEWQVYVSNILPSAVTDLVLFDRLPFVGDDRESEFAVTLAAAVTGAPSGATIEYSSDAASATSGTWSADPVGAVAFRITIPSIASGENFTLLVPTTVPEGVDFAEAATNNVTGSGIYNGSPRSFSSNNAIITAAPNPAFTLVKTTNGVAYSEAPGALVAEGSLVTWEYTVTNTGGTALADVAISDAFTDGTGASGTFTPTSTETGPLQPGESRTFTATGDAVLGQYQNTATASATPVDDAGQPLDVVLEDVTDESWYFAGAAGLEVVKTTNGVDVTEAPGLSLTPGDDVTWQYAVTNTGELDLVNVLVVDTDSDGNVVFSQTIPALAVGETVTLSATGVVIEGQYHNTVAVSAENPAGGAGLVGSDDSWYYGVTSGLTLEKLVADAESGPWVETQELESGAAAYWQLTVTNSGNSALTDVLVSDPALGEEIAIGELGAGESRVILLTQENVTESYINVATATGTDSLGNALTAEDDAAVTVDGATIPPTVTPDPSTDPEPTVTPDPSITPSAPAPSAPSHTPGQSGHLPTTGSSVSGVVILVGIMLILGAAFLTSRRFGRNAQADS
ncbi:DUF7507 domain-containing protein [Humidisolicoccus flavus]|uniref:DUF7507 domain-containing protein n=1 Tax=Humidisolicoccus flavus TaxID=3111414 RepID=UPI00324687B1